MTSQSDRLVIVCWVDAAFGLDTPPEVHEAQTIGWVVWQNQHAICVAGERLVARDSEEIMYRGHTTIPWESITSIKETPCSTETT